MSLPAAPSAPSRRRRPGRRAAAALALASLLGACGDDGGDAATGDGATSDTTVAGGQAPDRDEFFVELTRLCGDLGASIEDLDLTADVENDPEAAAGALDAFGAAVGDFERDVRALDAPDVDAVLEPLTDVAAAMEEAAGMLRDGASEEDVETIVPFERLEEADAAMIDLGFERGMAGCVAGEAPGSAADPDVDPAEPGEEPADTP